MHVELFRRFRADRSGSTAIFVAGIAAAVIAFTSLGVEVVLALDTQRRMQSAADSAAISAANSGTLTGSTFSCGSDCISTGYAVLEKAGFTSANNTCTQNPTVFVGSPCANDPAGASSTCSDGNCVEALIVAPYAMPLANVVGFGKGLNLHGQAVARMNTSQPACALALAPTAPGGSTITASGGANVSFLNCGLVANSTEPNAISANGGGSLSASQLFSGGNPGYSAAGGGQIEAGSPTLSSCFPLGSNSACMKQAPAAVNPYENLTVPTCTGGSSISKNTPSPVAPGCYDKLSLSGCSATITLAGGTYEFSHSGNNAFSVSTGCTLNANGPVTIILTSNGQVSISGGTTTLTAPSTGTYAGVLFFGPTATSTQSFIGGGSMTLVGGIVFPKAPVDFSGGVVAATPNSPCTTIIAWTMTFTGHSDLQFGCTTTNTKPILEPATLIE